MYGEKFRNDVEYWGNWEYLDLKREDIRRKMFKVFIYLKGKNSRREIRFI